MMRKIRIGLYAVGTNLLYFSAVLSVLKVANDGLSTYMNGLIENLAINRTFSVGIIPITTLILA